MNTLDNEVRTVVQNFMNSGELFTALDVSNKVKLVLPWAKHREVRDMVRGMFTNDIEPAGWARTPITVTLADGNTADALLYHSVSDSWDLDNKYSAQKRNQVTVMPLATTVTTVKTTPVTNVVVPSVSAAPPVAVPALPAKDRWNQLFNSQPSLFPLK